MNKMLLLRCQILLSLRTCIGFWLGKADINITVIACFFFGIGTDRTLNGSNVNDTLTEIHIHQK